VVGYEDISTSSYLLVCDCRTIVGNIKLTDKL